MCCTGCRVRISAWAWPIRAKDVNATATLKAFMEAPGRFVSSWCQRSRGPGARYRMGQQGGAGGRCQFRWLRWRDGPLSDLASVHERPRRLAVEAAIVSAARLSTRRVRVEQDAAGPGLPLAAPCPI